MSGLSGVMIAPKKKSIPGDNFRCTGKMHKVHDGPPAPGDTFRFGGQYLLTDESARTMGGLVREKAKEPSEKQKEPGLFNGSGIGPKALQRILDNVRE